MKVARFKRLKVVVNRCPTGEPPELKLNLEDNQRVVDFEARSDEFSPFRDERRKTVDWTFYVWVETRNP